MQFVARNVAVNFLARYICNYLHVQLHHVNIDYSYKSSHRTRAIANFLMCVTKKRTHHSLKS